ncbi:zinc-binding dehydrogenase [Mesorhizobium sp. Z1-4]|uniref:zinc-binding dehydrogenase n=1 Tax=Mesorhizobium sp. Z1-4 TaxID=2448478 RepID=UPI0013E0A822|nr:zinc-binding dehydrogenase [Mesorhizobium sp. Z1-4]
MPREWVIDAYDGFEGLRLAECEKCEPGPTEIRMHIEAFALNWGDMNLMKDQYSFSFDRFPARVGMEAAGMVEAVGADVTGIAVGERYCTLPHFYYNRGASADTLVIDRKYVTPAPEGLSAVEAASVWMQFMTAYYPVVELACAGSGVNILVPAGTSTAGTAALQIGRLRGATMIATTRSEKNRGYLLDSGADHVFVDNGGDLAGFLLDATGGVGIHGSFDPIGADFVLRYGPAMARDAKLMLYGLLTEELPRVPYVDMWQKNAWLHMYSLFNYVEDQDTQDRGTAFVYNALSEGSLKPNVDRVFPMEGYVDAWRYLSGPREHHGKVVIDTGR